MMGIRHGFTLQEKQGVRYLTIPSFTEAGGVLCVFSTRVGGVSPRPYDTLNFSQKREQSIPNFLENMQRLGSAAGFCYEDAIAINYAHSPALYRAGARDAGCGIVRDNLAVQCDGLYTDAQHLPIVSYHADCVPLFFYDPERRSIAVCHAGWRGVASHIVRNAVASLQGLGSDAKHILAAIGPCISVRHFEVGPDVGGVFEKEFGTDTVRQRQGRLYVDLSRACVLDMVKSGLAPENITVSDLCTYADSRLFFSHRRDHGKTGAMAAVMELRSE